MEIFTKNAALSTTVVAWGKSTKSLLSSRVLHCQQQAAIHNIVLAQYKITFTTFQLKTLNLFLLPASVNSQKWVLVFKVYNIPL